MPGGSFQDSAETRCLVKITAEDILAIFAEEANIEMDRLQPSSTMESLGIASLDIISVSFAIEDKYGVIIDAEAFAKCSHLQDVIEMIQAQAAQIPA
jgi:acyl carrier protein